MLDMKSEIILFKYIQKQSNSQKDFIDRERGNMKCHYLYISEPKIIKKRLTEGHVVHLWQENNRKRSEIMKFTNKYKI